MGQYITQDDLLRVMSQNDLIQLTDDEGVGEADATVVANAIADAEGEFAGYAGKRFTLPVDLTVHGSAAATIKRVISVLACYALWSRKARMSDGVRQRYEDAITWLRDLSRGLVTLGATPEPTDSGNTGRVQGGGETRRLTHETMTGL